MRLQKDKNRKRKRILSAVSAFVLAIYLGDLFSVQVVHSSDYKEKMHRASYYTVSVKASRGEILDRNGESLVSNREGFSVIFDSARFPSSKNIQERNIIVDRLVKLFRANDCEWIDAVPLEFDSAGNPVFPQGRESEIAYLKSKDILNLNEYASAQNCMDAIIEKYSLQNYSLQEAKDIASVYFSMFKNEFSASSPYTFAEDVPMKIVALIKENSDDYTGVDISVVSYREYADGTIAPHIIGTVGVISEEEYKSKSAELKTKLGEKGITTEQADQLKNDAYAMDDDIGKSGIEQLMESYLRGSPGKKRVEIDYEGNADESLTVAPRAGNTVILTIDKDIQAVAQQALEKRILELTAAEGLEAAGACVVLNCKTGEILAAASYPSYDLSTFYDDYNSLAANPASPLWNRVTQSTYAPGSTFKPVVALAALQEGVINKDSIFLCEGEFEYMDRSFGCLDYHGNLDVVSAIDKSCNIFFYNTADKLGISKMNTYASLFGLGSKTGVELPEVSGILASPENRRSAGGVWYSGDTIQAAIGQSDNLFTPIQLANYCATIANNGIRYVPHIIKSVKSADYSDSILDKTPEIAAEADISQEYFDIVKEGMRRVATTGFCQYAFENVPVKCGAKTGTSQVQKYRNGAYVKGNNGFLITFGPFDEPEIAIAVVIENVDSGTATANVAADIYEYYFGRTDSLSPAQGANSLLR